MRAPSAMASSFAHMTLGWTRRLSSSCAKPQSVPAMTFSRPTHSRESQDALGDKLRMFDDVRAVADDAGNQDLAFRQFDVLPDPPFVFVARIGGLDEIGAGADFQNEIDDLPQGNVGRVRTGPASPADVIAHAIFGNSLQRMVQHFDVAGQPAVVVVEAMPAEPSCRRSRRHGRRRLEAGSRSRQWCCIQSSRLRPRRRRILRRFCSIRSSGRELRSMELPPEGTPLRLSRSCSAFFRLSISRLSSSRPVYLMGATQTASRRVTFDHARHRLRRRARGKIP